MKLPSEILDIIASHGLDSCKTSIAWSDVSSYFRDLVKKLVGIVVIQDGSMNPLDDNNGFSSILNYKVLLHEEHNTLFVNADMKLSSEVIVEFLNRFNNLVLVIQSDRSFSDPLTSTLNEIARCCHHGTNLCIIYSTSMNFLSKLYFREFGLRENDIILSELHVIGTQMIPKEADLCDIDTLFESTYLYNLNNLFSLSVRHEDHHLIAPKLNSIRQLNYQDPTFNLYNFLSSCKGLKVIESMKFPLSANIPEENLYILPSCDKIHLNNYNTGVIYPIVDGSAVRRELKISPTIRASDPEFSNLYFERIRVLEIEMNPSTTHHVRFVRCNFSNLRSLQLKSCMAHWDDLVNSNSYLYHLKVNINSIEQLKWLSECPFNLKTLEIASSTNRILDFNCDPLMYNEMKINFSHIKMDIQTVWSLYLLDKVIMNPDNGNMILEIDLHEQSLGQSIIDCPKTLEEMGFCHVNECIICPIESIDHFTLIACDTNEIPNIQSSIKTSSDSIRNLPEIPIRHTSFDYGSRFINTNESLADFGFGTELNPVVSPSIFRWNNVIGNTNENLRKSSIISLESQSPITNRRASSVSASSMFSRSSYPFVSDEVIQDECITFEFRNRPPNILTTTLGTIESSVFSFKQLRTRNLPHLEIIANINIAKSEQMAGIIDVLKEKIHEILEYRYDTKLSDVHIVNLHITLRTQGIMKAMQSEIKKNIQLILQSSKHPIVVVEEHSFSKRYDFVPVEISF
ncbi:ancestral locus [Nakaseomyces bracarensis]|uniref:ancestral locus n=1 Tax=Nakaseomyces bracarensis TaxID=273131 RepID=UPI003871150F